MAELRYLFVKREDTLSHRVFTLITQPIGLHIDGTEFPGRPKV